MSLPDGNYEHNSILKLNFKAFYLTWLIKVINLIKFQNFGFNFQDILFNLNDKSYKHFKIYKLWFQDNLWMLLI